MSICFYWCLFIFTGRILDDDDSEYDSSLDDFIDDGPEDGNDVSSYIKEIFGYDKSKYEYIYTCVFII